MKPLAIDLFCGLGGWAEGFLSEGYDVIGFDIERHDYGTGGYPGQLVLQDVLTLHGSQFRSAAVIVASPPCQEYSYMAMPWSRAKAKAAWYREEATRQLELNCLFNACFRIAHEASVPLVVENVKGAEPWVGGARWHFGSFYLWGNVPALMPPRGVIKNNDGSWFAIRSQGQTNVCQNPDGRKIGTGEGYERGKREHLTNPAEQGRKVAMNFHEHEKTGKPGRSFQSAAVEGTKQHGSGPEWFDNGLCKVSSKSSARKAASAQIAKIPFPLAQWIARCFKP